MVLESSEYILELNFNFKILKKNHNGINLTPNQHPLKTHTFGQHSL